MDLGIAGYWAIITAASRGLGKGCAKALAQEGVNLVINARNIEALVATARELTTLNTGVEIRTVAGDVGDETVRSAILAACPRVDILINNNGGPPPGDFRDWTREDWQSALNANMITPIELIKSTVDAMAAQGFGRVLNITSGAVKAPIDILGLSNGARTGLTGFVAGLARQPQLVSNNVTINNLLPGAFDTERLRSAFEAGSAASGHDVTSIKEQRLQGIPAGRFGSIDEFGAFCAFLCSQHAGYLTGQNILLDGGSYPGTF
jgi:3-oxoacyl-[acyl-carrier protein] reductase